MIERDALPEPMRVSDAMIARARREVESRFKRTVRAAVLPYLKWRHQFLEVGEGFQWGRPLGTAPNALRIGRYVFIGAYGSIDGPTVIGDFCMLSSFVRFIGNDHRSDVVGGPIRLEFEKHRPVTILEADCWIGQGAMIRQGVRIGRGAVVGAGSTVTQSVEPYDIVVGSPARVLRSRFDAASVLTHDSMLFGSSAT